MMAHFLPKNHEILPHPAERGVNERVAQAVKRHQTVQDRAKDEQEVIELFIITIANYHRICLAA
jgi:hypothetical protein